MNAEQITNLIVKLAAAVIPLLLAALLPLIKQYIATLDERAKAGMGQQKYWLALEITKTVVEGIEQQSGWSNMNSEQKKAMAVILLDEICSRHNVPLSAEQLSMLVEAAVKEMNGKDPVAEKE